MAEDFETRKRITIEVAQEHHNMSPVTKDGWVFWVQCNTCGKKYKWNSSVWQMRHKRKCNQSYGGAARATTFDLD